MNTTRPSFQKQAFKALCMVALGVSVFSFTSVKPAYAVVPVAETGGVVVNEILATAKEWGLDSLAYSLASLAGQKISTVIVNKITGGASGDSASQVVQDFGQLILNNRTQQGKILSDQLLKKGANELSKEFSPYAKNVAIDLTGFAQNTFEEASSGIPANLPSFGIKNLVGDKWKDFENDASLGGWDGIFELAKPGNTAIGFNLQAGEELGRRISARKEELQLKLTSNGVEPTKGKCDTSFKGAIDPLLNAPENPGAEFSFQATNYVSATPKDASGKTYDEAFKEWSQQKAEYQNWEKVSNAGVNNLAENTTPCLIESIKNPVGTVQDLTNTALNSGIETLGSSDEIGEVIGAMILSFVKGAINAGVSAVRSDLAQKNTKSIGGPEQVSSDPSRWNQTPARVVDMKTELGTAVVNTGREIYYLEKALGEYDTYPKLVYELNQCMPTPKVGWEKRLDKLFKSSTSKLEKRTLSKREKIATRAQDILDNVTVSMETASRETQLALLRGSLNIPGFAGMQAEIDKFTDKSNDRKQLYKSMLDRKAAQANLEGIMQDIKGSMAGLYPSGFKPLLTRIEWENATAAERTTDLTIAKDKTGQDVTIESLDQNLLPDDFIPVYYTSSAQRPANVSKDNKAWDELTETEKEKSYQAAELDYLEIRNPGGEAISQCTDHVDNNANGKIDEVDPGCTAPYALDNDEAQVAPPLSIAQKRDKVIALTKSLTEYSIVSFYQWDRWNNGENVVLSENVSSFKKQKDSVRQRFARLDELLGNASTISKARTSYEAELSSNRKIQDLTNDCQTLRRLVYVPPANQGAGNQLGGIADSFLGAFGGNTDFADNDLYLNGITKVITAPQYIQYCPNLSGKNILEQSYTSPSYVSGPMLKECLNNLLAHPESGVTFKTQEVINGIKLGGSALDRDCKTNPGTDCNAGISSATSYTVTSTPADINASAPDETTVTVPAGLEVNQTTGAPYQQQTQFDLQHIFDHDYKGNLFCKFDDRMKTYQDDLKPVIKVGRPMSCEDGDQSDPTSPAKEQWYAASRGEVLILYYPKNLDF